MLEIKGQVLHHVCRRVHLKIPGWSSESNAPLTRKLLVFLSRLNEIRGGYRGREGTSDFGLPTSDFRLQTSDFRTTK